MKEKSVRDGLYSTANELKRPRCLERKSCSTASSQPRSFSVNVSGHRD